MTMSTALVVWPGPDLRFNTGRWGTGGLPPFPPIRYRAPRDTTDPRWSACRDHRVACDCREAEFAEELNELRYERKANRLMEQAIDAVLTLHVIDTPRWGRDPRCRECGGIYPCPTRNLLAPLSWTERHRPTTTDPEGTHP